MKKATIAPITLLLALTGCGNGTPDCGSDEVLELTTAMFVERMLKEMNWGLSLLGPTYSARVDEWLNAAVYVKPAGKATYSARVGEWLNVQLTPTFVRMTGYDKQTDTYTCAATMRFKMAMTDPTGRTGFSEEQEGATEFNFLVSSAATGGGEVIVEQLY